jgi:uncharacterized protein (DUF1778 family)
MRKAISMNRLSIDIDPEEHRLIKISAALHNQTIKEYLLEAIRKYIREEMENEHLRSMTSEISQSLQKLWNNKKDSDYDKL